MRIAIITDLHANLEATRSVFDDIDQRGVDKIICLGDLAGYNANPNEVIDIIREREIPSIMGNHDAAVGGLEDPWFFRAAAKRAAEWQIDQLRDDNRKWLLERPDQITFAGINLAVHGSPSSRDDYIVDWLDAVRQIEFINDRDIQICFFGHSHRPSFFCEQGVTTTLQKTCKESIRHGVRYFINPGAVGQPRDRDSRAAFGIFDTDEQSFEFCRVIYDIDLTIRKIMDAKLPQDLARRLKVGK